VTIRRKGNALANSSLRAVRKRAKCISSLLTVLMGYCCRDLSEAATILEANFSQNDVRLIAICSTSRVYLMT
jgi:hypothetical protein